MAVEMWLMRDEAWTVFDWKPIAGCMEQPYDVYSGKKVYLSEEDYAEYQELNKKYHEWQARLSSMIDDQIIEVSA